MIPRVTRDLIRRILGRRAHSKLVHVRLADEHRIRLPQSAYDGRIVGRNELLQNLAAAGGRTPSLAQYIFDRDGNARESSNRLAERSLGVDQFRLCERVVAVDV